MEQDARRIAPSTLAQRLADCLEIEIRNCEVDHPEAVESGNHVEARKLIEEARRG